jgi:hypothetical protein
MSTPPTFPDVLQKVTIVLSVILGLTFGLCTVGTVTTRTINDHLITTALIIEAICILGLIVIAVIVIFRALRGDY